MIIQKEFYAKQLLPLLTLKLIYMVNCALKFMKREILESTGAQQEGA